MNLFSATSYLSPEAATEVERMAHWLWATGYPFDWCSEIAPPEEVVRVLIRLYGDDDGWQETWEEYASSLLGEIGDYPDAP